MEMTKAKIIERLKEIDKCDEYGEGGGVIMWGWNALYVNNEKDCEYEILADDTYEEMPHDYSGELIYTGDVFFKFPDGALAEFGIDGTRLWACDARYAATDAEFAAMAGDPATDFFHRNLYTVDGGTMHSSIAYAGDETGYEHLAQAIIDYTAARAAGIAPVSPQELFGN